MARVPDDATAFAHGDRRFMVNVAAMYGRLEEGEAYAPWVADLAAQLQRGPVGAYVGFLGDEGEARAQDAYPKPTWDRLADVKARYDPGNLFRLNQNVRPANG
jgi:FAD/FMN-containing dehydrogenase